MAASEISALDRASAGPGSSPSPVVRYTVRVLWSQSTDMPMAFAIARTGRYVVPL